MAQRRLLNLWNLDHFIENLLDPEWQKFLTPMIILDIRNGFS